MIAQILAELPGLFGGINAPGLQTMAAPGDVFEVYVFGLILEAARREEAVVGYENVNGPFQGVGTFRTTPGRIWSQTAAYTHAILQFQGCLWRFISGFILRGSPAGFTKPMSLSSLDQRGCRAVPNGARAPKSQSRAVHRRMQILRHTARH